MAAIEAIIKQLSVPVLKAELSKRGLQVKGKKDELLARLLSAIESLRDFFQAIYPSAQWGLVEI